MLKGLITALLVCGVAACATQGQERAFQFIGVNRLGAGARPADVREVVVGDKVFSLWFHPRDNAVLVARRSLPSLGAGVATWGELAGVSVNDGPQSQWRAAAEFVLAPLGCQISDVFLLSTEYWEARYRCADGRHIDGAELESRRGVWQARMVAPYP